MQSMALLLLLIVIYFCRFSLINARKQLSLEQKGQLLDVVSSNRSYLNFFGIIVFGILLALVIESINVLLFYPLVFIGRQIYYFQQIKKLNFPENFLNDYLLYSTLLYTSLIAFLLVITHHVAH